MIRFQREVIWTVDGSESTEQRSDPPMRHCGSMSFAGCTGRDPWLTAILRCLRRWAEERHSQGYDHTCDALLPTEPGASPRYDRYFILMEQLPIISRLRCSCHEPKHMSKITHGQQQCCAEQDAMEAAQAVSNDSCAGHRRTLAHVSVTVATEPGGDR